MSNDLLIKKLDSDFWEYGDFVTPTVSIGGRFTVGKEYQIKRIDWEDILYVNDDSEKENGLHMSQWKFIKGGCDNEI